MPASRASARLADATPAPMAGSDKNDKAALATKATMLISGGKFADLKALRDGDTVGAFKDAADRTIRTRLTAIRDNPSLSTAAAELVAKEAADARAAAANALAAMATAGEPAAAGPSAADPWPAVPETERTNENKAARRSLSFKFCVAKYSELHRSGRTTTAPQVVREAIELFGEDVKWSALAIKLDRFRHVALNLSLKSTDIPGPPERGRPTYYPPYCCVCGRGCGRRPRRRWRCGGGAARDRREPPARARR